MTKLKQQIEKKETALPPSALEGEVDDEEEDAELIIGDLFLLMND